VQPIVAIFVLWMFWVLTWLAALMGARHEVRKLSRMQDAAYRAAVLLGALLLCSFTPWPGLDVQYTLWRTLNSTAGWLMVLLAFLGFSFAWWARIHRGLHWARVDARTEEFHLVQSGPYGVVRQPIYLGLIVAAFAAAVVFGRPSSFCGAFVMSIAFITKALIEERELRAELGAYDDYAGRVFMFFPSFRRHKKETAPASSLLHRTEPAGPKNEIAPDLQQGVADAEPAAKR
jgi:protein-S-isoprenylcysteine O-methyltransferase Ste14